MMVAVLDGSVRAINPATKPDVLEKLISRAAGR